MSCSWDDALGALNHLEVVQGLPGQGFPPAYDEEGLPAEGHAVSSNKPPPSAPPPPRQQQQQQQQSAATPAVLGKNPSQLLNEFYNRFKGLRDVSFERIVDETNDTKLWQCTINLSGGRLNDREPLVPASFQAKDRSKKGAEAAASRAALEHLASMGYLNAETASAQSNKQDRWALPQRRLPDSELVCFDFTAGPEAGEGLPDGQIVVELFHDVAPQTLANLKHFFGLGRPGCLGTHASPPPATQHISSQRGRQNGAATEHNNGQIGRQNGAATEHDSSQRSGQNGAAIEHKSSQLDQQNGAATDHRNSQSDRQNGAASEHSDGQHGSQIGAATEHSNTQHGRPNGAAQLHTNCSSGAVGSPAAHSNGCHESSGNGCSAAAPQHGTSDTSTGISAPSSNPITHEVGRTGVSTLSTTPITHEGCSHASTPLPNLVSHDSPTGVRVPAPKLIDQLVPQESSNGYVGCSIVCPVLKGCLAFTPPAILPHSLSLGSTEGASYGTSSQGATNCGTCCCGVPSGINDGQPEDGEKYEHTSQNGSGRAAQGVQPGVVQGDGKGGAGGSGATVAEAVPPVDPAKDEVVVDALARLLDMQEAGQGLEEDDDEGEEMQEDLGEDRGPQGQREEPQKGSQGSIPQQGLQEQQQHQQPDLEQRDGRSRNGQQQQQQRLSEHKNGSARKEQQQEQQQQPACDEHQRCDKLQAGQQQQQWQEQQQEPQVLEEQELQPQSRQHPQHQQQQQQQCEGQECEGQHQWEHQQQQQQHHHQHQQQRQQDLRSCIDDGEAADESMLLRHDKPFRVSLLRDANTLAESAALNIIIPSLPAYNDSHFIVGQVVRGFGMARFMESCASNEDVVYGIYSKAPSQKGPKTGPYHISGCRLLPPTASLEDVPVIMDGDWPAWPEDLPPVPPGMSEAEWRLCGAEAMRATANAAFKAGAWEAAACKYTHALRYLSLRSLQSSALKYSEKQQILDLQCRTLLNRSATAVHLGQGMAAMTDAKNVLDQCPEGHSRMPKALYRLGQGLMGVGRHEEAVERLQQALQLTGPNAPDIRAAITHAKQLLKQQRARQGEAYARALQGWGSRRAPGTSRRRGADFDGGEFEEGKAWLLNPKAEAVLERLGGDAPFRGMISMQGCDGREGRT